MKVADVELFAWVGEDEFGSGEIGIKRAHCAAGFIPMVAVNREKMMRFKPAFEVQASAYGKRIYLCRFTVAEIVTTTRMGDERSN